jgi:hypothetical protein
MMAQRSNLIWPVLIIGVGITMLLISADVIPEAIGDVLVRSWPVLLIIFGLNVLLAQRLPYANWVVLGLGVVLVVIIANIAYAERSGQYRDDYRESRIEIIPPEVESLIVQVDIRETRATISPSGDTRQVIAQFEGSNESDVKIDLTIEGSTGILTIQEDRPGVLPRLSEVGRGTLNIFLPSDVPIQAISYAGDDGSVTADLRALTVRELDMTIDRGNMNLCLPQASNIVRDAITMNNGNLRVFNPQNIAVRFVLGDNTQIQYAPETLEGSQYLELASGVLQTNLVQEFDILLNLNIDGRLTLDHTRDC